MIRLVLTCILVAAASPVSAGPLALAARQDAVIGRDASITITVGEPMPLRWFATAGSIAPGADRVSAELTLPVTGPPQFVIAAAVSSAGAVVGWLAIPLSAQARVRVETAPRAEVTVDVGGREFGPVRADREGIASVEIIVPPGIDEVTTRTVDRHGGTRVETRPLDTSPSPGVLAVCARDAPLTVIAVTATGAPSPETPQVTTSRGELSALVETAGVNVATIDLAAAATGEVVITASLATASSTCSFDHVVPPEVVEVVPFEPRPEPTASPPRARVALRAGWLDNLGRVSAPTVALDASIALYRDHVVAGIELGGYHAASSTAAETGEPVDVTVTATVLLARLGYQVAVGRAHAWTGVGAGALLADTRLESLPTGMQRAQVVRPAVSVFAGGSLDVGPGALVAEAGYWHARTETGDVQGRLGGLVLTIGYALSR